MIVSGHVVSKKAAQAAACCLSSSTSYHQIFSRLSMLACPRLYVTCFLLSIYVLPPGVQYTWTLKGKYLDIHHPVVVNKQFHIWIYYTVWKVLRAVCLFGHWKFVSSWLFNLHIIGWVHLCKSPCDMKAKFSPGNKLNFTSQLIKSWVRLWSHQVDMSPGHLHRWTDPKATIRLKSFLSWLPPP